MNADGPAPKVLLADKGYDADFIREDMERRGGTAMIPTKRNRLVQLPVDAAIYALRNMVERCFNKLKNARRLATRYDKTADSYLGFIHIVSIRLWTRQFVNASYIIIYIGTSGHNHVDSQVDIFYDGITIPLQDASVDHIVSLEAFEHIFNLPKILGEGHRILKPGGPLMISIPFGWD